MFINSLIGNFAASSVYTSTSSLDQGIIGGEDALYGGTWRLDRTQSSLLIRCMALTNIVIH